jgi:hypothetical protein
MDHASINVAATPTVSSDFFMLSSVYFRCSLTPDAFYTARAAEFTVERRRLRNIAKLHS